MIPTPQAESKYVHPLARFVTAEAIALLLNVEIARITDIRCWANVILVVGKGFSKFVSYADLPPISGVEPPTQKDFACWRKRWQKRKTKLAPNYWLKFYAQKLGKSASEAELYAWGQLLRIVKFVLCEKAVTILRSIYAEEGDCLKNTYVETQHHNIESIPAA